MNGPSLQDLRNRIIWIRGIPPIDFWIRRETMIGNFIKENKLEQINTAGYELEGFASAAQAAEEKAALPMRRPPFPGGMRIPHLHFQGEVYRMDQQQWTQFSGKVVADLNAKLKSASALSFDQIRDVAGEIDKFA